MLPATGPPPSAEAALAALGDAGDPPRAIWDDPRLEARAAEPLARAALAGLAGTVAEPLLVAFLAGDTPVDSLAVGAPEGPGRVVGPTAGTTTGLPGARVVNDRYQGEHPLLIAPSLAHALAWSGPGAAHAEETALHLLVAVVHAQLVARTPALAHRGTELARRQNSLVLPLLCSRHPGEHTLSPVAPDGEGTAPGGDPSMGTPDFWSIPFAPRGPGAPIPPAARQVFANLGNPPVSPATITTYDDSLGELLSDHGLEGALALRDHLAVAVTLGVVTGTDLEDATGLPAPGAAEALGVSDALAVWATR